MRGAGSRPLGYSPTVFCPRCGDESPDGVRYCASCGGALPRLDGSDDGSDDGAAPAATGLRARWAGRIRRLAGRTRRERIISGATAALVLVAVIAFLNLDTPEEGLAPGPERDALDAACVAAKAQVVEAANSLSSAGDAEGYAFNVVIGMLDLRDAAAASGLAGVEDLSAAALAAAAAAGRVGRLSREKASPDELQSALEESTSALEGLSAPTEELGLETCTTTTIDRDE